MRPDGALVAPCTPMAQVPLGLVVLNDGTAAEEGDRIVAEVITAVRAEVGAVASLRRVAVVEALPKTRSGKTLRGIIQAVADGRHYTLPGTVEDASAVDAVAVALRRLGYPTTAT